MRRGSYRLLLSVCLRGLTSNLFLARFDSVFVRGSTSRKQNLSAMNLEKGKQTYENVQLITPGSYEG